MYIVIIINIITIRGDRQHRVRAGMALVVRRSPAKREDPITVPRNWPWYPKKGPEKDLLSLHKDFFWGAT